MQLQTSLVSPPILALWHMPRMFTKFVPRCREAEPSVSRSPRRQQVSTTWANSHVVSSRRASLLLDIPGSCHVPVGLGHVKRFHTAWNICDAISEILASNREGPKLDLREIGLYAGRPAEVLASALILLPGEDRRRRTRSHAVRKLGLRKSTGLVCGFCEDSER